MSVASHEISHGATSPRLQLSSATVADPDGHHPALRLKGDWLVIAISDGTHTGLGEISHSRDDRACLQRVRELFAAHVSHQPPTRKLLREFAAAFAKADLVTATAISGIDQALHDLVAQREGLPVWRLYTDTPVQPSVPCYLSTNRALRGRTPADFVGATNAALALGVRAVKLTPFEAVTEGGEQLPRAEEGFARIEAVRAAHPRISLRVDCHERFTPENTATLLPRFARYNLEWLEEPCPPGHALAGLRAQAKMPFAIGELFFGEGPFRELLEHRRADVIMPDPKHVGGFASLVRVCRMAEKLRGQVSPHNPSGPVATRAAVHAAAVSAAVTSVELILTSDRRRQPGRELLANGRLRVPLTPGWGLSIEQLTADTGAQFAAVTQ
ncbi:MAG: enolase C-terminal domain-like protein [Opitutaceae bacterium]|nr:enolase C-terminal domain-like protein [Opitutaceae bacterium]